MFKYIFRFLLFTIFATICAIALIAYKPDWRNISVQYILEKQLSTDDYIFKCKSLDTELTRKGLNIDLLSPTFLLKHEKSNISAPLIKLNIALNKWRILTANISMQEIELNNPMENLKVKDVNLKYRSHLLRVNKRYSLNAQGLTSTATVLHNIDNISVDVIANKLRNAYQIKKAEINFANSGFIKIQGGVSLSNQSPTALTLSGSIHNTRINNWKIIQRFYNNPTIKPTWDFLDEFIKSGYVNEGDFAISLKKKHFKHNAKITEENLKGHFLLTDITVDYGSEFPQVTNISADLKLNGAKLSFDILRATSNHTNLSEGSVTLDLNKKYDYVEVITHSKGPIRDLIDFIPQRDRNDLKEAKLDFEQISGDAITDARLIIPLNDDPIIFDVNTELLNTQLNLLDDKVQIKDTRLDGHFTGDSLTLVGKGIINDYDSDINFMSNFTDTPSHKLNILFTMTNLPNPDEVIEITDGSAEGRITILKTAQDTSINAEIDFDKTAYKIPIFGITTDINTKSKAKLSTKFTDGNYIPVQLDITSDKGLVLDLVIDYNNDEWNFNIKKARDYHIDFSGAIKLTPSLLRADIKGNLVDISDIHFGQFTQKPTLAEKTEKNSTIKPQEEEEEAPARDLDINMQLRQVKMKNNIWFDHVRVDLNCDAQKCSSGYVNAQVGTKELSIIREENTPGIEEWRVFSDNAGAVLQATDIYNKLRAGHLLLVLKRNYASADKIITANFVVNDFITTDTPFATRLISFISLPGLMSTIVNNGNISFKEMQGRFNYVDNLVTIEHIGAEGPYFDFTLKGTIDTDKRKYRLTGSVSPSFFGISTIVRYVPILGTIFSGGSRKGLIVAPFILKDSY